MAYIFDITENMQASIRLGTGIHPDGPSFGIFIGTLDCFDSSNKTAFNMSAYDACDWKRAVRFAKWILEMDECFKKEGSNEQ